MVEVRPAVDLDGPASFVTSGVTVEESADRVLEGVCRRGGFRHNGHLELCDGDEAYINAYDGWFSEKFRYD